MLLTVKFLIHLDLNSPFLTLEFLKTETLADNKAICSSSLKKSMMCVGLSQIDSEVRLTKLTVMCLSELNYPV